MKSKIIATISCLLLISLIGCTNNNEQTQIEFPISWYDGGFWPFLHVAIDQGYFKEEGLDVKIVENKGSAITAQLIGSGKYPIGIVAGDVALIAKSKGLPIKVLGVVDKISYSGITCHANANVKEAKDLEGKKVGVTITSNTYQQYLAYLKKTNVNKTKIKEIPIGGPGHEFFARKVDCHALTPYVTESLAELKGVEVDIIEYHDVGLEVYGSTIVANENAINQNPKLISKVVKALTKGIKFEKEHPDKAFQIMLKNNPNLKNPEYEKLLFEKRIASGTKLKVGNPGDGLMNQKDWQKSKEILEEVEMIQNDFNLKDFFTNKYVEK